MRGPGAYKKAPTVSPLETRLTGRNVGSRRPEPEGAGRVARMTRIARAGVFLPRPCVFRCSKRDTPRNLVRFSAASAGLFCGRGPPDNGISAVYGYAVRMAPSLKQAASK